MRNVLVTLQNIKLAETPARGPLRDHAIGERSGMSSSGFSSCPFCYQFSSCVCSRNLRTLFPLKLLLVLLENSHDTLLHVAIILRSYIGEGEEGRNQVRARLPYYYLITIMGFTSSTFLVSLSLFVVLPRISLSPVILTTPSSPISTLGFFSFPIV